MEISDLQKDLVAAFRWTARLNMNEGIANHFSVCMPNSNNFYVNSFIFLRYCIRTKIIIPSPSIKSRL